MLSLALILAAAPTADHQFLLTAKDLQSYCAKKDDLRTGVCVGYVLAATDQATFQDTANLPRKLCLPAKLTNADLRDAVMSTFAADTDGLALPAVLYVRKALQIKFGCSRSVGAAPAHPPKEGSANR